MELPYASPPSLAELVFRTDDISVHVAMPHPVGIPLKEPEEGYDGRRDRTGAVQITLDRLPMVGLAVLVLDRSCEPGDRPILRPVAVAPAFDRDKGALDPVAKLGRTHSIQPSFTGWRLGRHYITISMADDPAVCVGQAA